MKKNLNSIPEIYLVISALFYWFSTTFYNPIAFVIISIFLFQLLSKNKITGLIIAFIFVSINLYLTFALFSELSEFKTHNDEWLTMLLVGSTYISLNIILGIIMFIRYVKELLKKYEFKATSGNTIK